MSSIAVQRRRDELSELRLRGYRRTLPRTQVLQALHALGSGTPDEITEHVDSAVPGISRSTVYRTLDLLERLGLVLRVRVDRGPIRYHLRHNHDHVHLVCLRCGVVIEAPTGVIATAVLAVASDHEFQADASLMLVPGHCRSCAASTAEESS
jgi:Fur family transcriptional regulator, ferric uptake regulator